MYYPLHTTRTTSTATLAPAIPVKAYARHLIALDVDVD